MSKSKIFLTSLSFFIVGVGLASFCPADLLQAKEFLWFALAAACLAAAGLIKIFFSKDGIDQSRLYFYFIFFLSFLWFGVWRYAFLLPADSQEKIWHYNGRRASVIGAVAAEPDVRDSNIRLEIDAASIVLADQKSKPVRVEGLILVTASRFPEYDYGDRLAIDCQLSQPEAFDGFAYDRFLAVRNIYTVCDYPKVRLVGTGGGRAFYKKLLEIKNEIYAIIDRGLAEPEASLTKAIMLGNQRGVPAELKDEFSRAGVSHIMAISGMNITIFSSLLFSLLLFVGLSRRGSFYAASFLLFAYIAMIGAPASAVRAGVMGFLFLLAAHLGRLGKIINVVILAAVIMLWLNPKLFRDDLSFQLSFLAMLGIIRFYPAIKKWFDSLIGTKNELALRAFAAGGDVLAVTLAAQVFTLPVLVYNFGQASLAAPAANLLILWTQPPFMVFSLAAIALSAVFASLANIFFLPGAIFLKYVVLVSGLIAGLPVAAKETSLASLLAVYAAAGGGWFLTAKINSQNQKPKARIKF